ncbi:hypothetical protein [Enterococcus mundtii]|uniref:hypothetical protein n=1 Tax=Enterococcus mundtii TaxID=53346 RepID=UPI001CF12BEB|nr:hypothetical protein [Enterococcus mundtii]MCA6775313.1 hypothetical protein [Enterococcus mundtii]
MLKVGDLVLWGINVNPAWHIVVERTQFKSTTQYSFVTLTTGAVTAEWIDTLEDLYEHYKDFIISRISPDFSPTIDEIKNETSNRMKVAMDKNIKMMDELGYHPDEQKLNEITEWLEQ